MAAFAGCGDTPNDGPEREWNNSPKCPADDPTTGDACSGNIECLYGEETCCGETNPAYGCACFEGEFTCFATDACLGAIFVCPEEFPCSDEECGPGPGAPNILCEDGSIAGPVCLRNDEGECGWRFTSCPEDSCDPDNNEYETAGCGCDTDAECTCQVFTGAMFLPESQQSACDPDTGTCIPCLYL